MFLMKPQRFLPLIGLSAIGLVACGDGQLVGSPTSIDLYPSATASRLFVMTTAVGSAPVNLPLIFDTGSAGVTLYAPSIFPTSMVSASWFVFPKARTP